MGATPPPRHVLITRFNTRLSAEAAPPSEAWLQDRLELFVRYALPSVKSQTVPPDTWLIFCDSRSPLWFKDALTTLLPAWAEVTWLSEPFTALSAVKEITKDIDSPWVITTRMDNDDCIAVDYLRSIRSQATSRREFINFPRGMQAQDGLVYHRVDPSNAFLSLVEPTAGMTTVFVDLHNRASNHAPVRQVQSPPMWLQLVHGQNLVNSIRGVRARPAIARERFHAELGLTDSSWIRISANQAWTMALIATRTLTRPRRIKWLVRSLIPSRRIWPNARKSHS